MRLLSVLLGLLLFSCTGKPHETPTCYVADYKTRRDWNVEHYSPCVELKYPTNKPYVVCFYDVEAAYHWIDHVMDPMFPGLKPCKQ